MPKISRREFLKWSSRSAAALVISQGIGACSSDDDATLTGEFTHGIASGDPLGTSIILWTRAVPVDEATATVTWQVAADENFNELLHTGNTTVEATTDYTLKVDVQNLSPGTRYFYRFKSGSNTSDTGNFRTLPEGNVPQVKFAVVSCSNYPAGYFHPYAEAAKEDNLDAVIHLGDYIYEYGADGYATEDAVALGRTLADDNNTEILTLNDYRKRYQLYRSDTDLQALHAAAAFIAVWDDHEITNDTWREGAENHDASEGDFNERKQMALQAYFEWMPIRPASEGNYETIYRQFQFGNLVNLMMLDTRIVGRDEQLSYNNYIDPATGAFNTTEFIADVSDINRTLLGAEQLGWLQSQLGASQATWEVLGQQVLMGRMNIPSEILFASTVENPDPVAVATVINELVAIKVRQLQNDPTLTETELARLAAIPYNLDAWDGYAAEREAILGTAATLDKNLIVIAGDTHNAWANNLKDLQGNAVGVEFATASVTSPGLEDFFALPDLASAAQTEGALELLIDDLQYLNVAQRGFMVLTITADEARADWHFVDTIKSTEYTIDSTRGKTLAVEPGSGNRFLIS